MAATSAGDGTGLAALPGRLPTSPARAADRADGHAGDRLGQGAPDAFAPHRAAMIDSQLRTSDVTDAAIIAAMGAMPREAFVPASRVALAYADRIVPLDADDPARALNSPLATGRLLVAADVRPGERALLLGAATGYAAALLDRLGAGVVAHDDDADLADRMVAVLAIHAPAVRVARGPVSELLADPALARLFDVVVIDGAVEVLPDGLAQLLVDGGRLATGLVDGSVTRLARAVKAGPVLAPVPFADVGCVILPGYRRPPAFRF